MPTERAAVRKKENPGGVIGFSRPGPAANSRVATRLRRALAARAALAGINAAVVGVLGAALYNPIWLSAVGNGRDVAIALVGFLLLERWRVPPLAIVVFCVGAALISAAVRCFNTRFARAGRAPALRKKIPAGVTGFSQPDDRHWWGDPISPEQQTAPGAAVQTRGDSIKRAGY